jgi:hypothetical protein
MWLKRRPARVLGPLTSETLRMTLISSLTPLSPALAKLDGTEVRQSITHAVLHGQAALVLSRLWPPPGLGHFQIPVDRLDYGSIAVVQLQRL